MMRLAILLAWLALSAAAEVHTLTMKQLLERAAAQNPDLVIARLEERKAAEQIRVARDPFLPKLYAGSGLAASAGFPMSIEGAAPAVFQARAVASVFNRPQSLHLAQARENARGAVLDTEGRRQQILQQAAALYLECERLGRHLEAAELQSSILESVAALTKLRVSAGHALPVDALRAELDVAKSKQRREALAADRDHAEGTLAVLVGFAAGDRVQAAREARLLPDVPETEADAAASALETSAEVRSLESALLAKGFERQAHQAARWPRLDLVAQYGLFARFNNYEDFFRRFQRHNGQLGVSFQLPLWTGAAAEARAAQADADITRLRVALGSLRARLDLEARQSFRLVRKAVTAKEIASLELELAREHLNVVKARYEEGRAPLTELESARYQETEKWTLYYDALYGLEATRVDLLQRTGALEAWVR